MRQGNHDASPIVKPTLTAFGDDGTNLRTYATPCGADERQLQALVHPNATHVQYRLG